MKLIQSIILILSLLIHIACNDNDVLNPNTLDQSIIDRLASDYDQLPEGQISVSSDYRVYAQYSVPTEKYRHGIMGDRVEAEQLVVVVDNIFYEWTLASNYVYEDIRPRLFDVDGDGELEIITIRSEVSQGAGIVIYKIVGDHIEEYAHVEEIGHMHNWLNIVAIDDLDSDGVVELVWIQTPHIGGILKTAKIGAGRLGVIDMLPGYSNHGLGERNLCLSVLTGQNSDKVFYVPSQDRDRIAGFTLTDNKFEVYEEIIQDVDFSMPLKFQYNFTNTIEKENNCIDVN
jgi:hypothetical protein